MNLTRRCRFRTRTRNPNSRIRNSAGIRQQKTEIRSARPSVTTQFQYDSAAGLEVERVGNNRCCMKIAYRPTAISIVTLRAGRPCLLADPACVKVVQPGPAAAAGRRGSATRTTQPERRLDELDDRRSFRGGWRRRRGSRSRGLGVPRTEGSERVTITKREGKAASTEPPTGRQDTDHIKIIVLFGAGISRPENRAGSALAGRPGGRAGEQPLRWSRNLNLKLQVDSPAPGCVVESPFAAAT